MTPSRLLPFALVAVAACAPSEPSEPVFRTAEQPIKGGYTETDMPNVVGVVNTDGGICSGSLILPNLVLTARHCVSNVSQQILCGSAPVGALKPAGKFFVTTKYQLTQNPADYHAVSKVIGLPGTSDICGYDQALLQLADNVDPAEAEPLVPRVDTELHQDDEYYAVGYGGTNDAGSGVGTRRRRDGLFVTCFGDLCPPSLAEPTEWVGDTGICGGDSGGPALDLQGRVVGVTSRGAANCDSPVYGSLLGWADWLKEKAAAAAADGGYDPPPWVLGAPTDPAYYAPIGDACSDPSTCPGGLCITDEQGSYCSKPCTELTSCGDGFACTNGECTKIPPPPPPPDGGAGGQAGDPGVQTGGGCAVGRSEPTKPMPWVFGVAAAAGALLRRRRRGA